MSSRIVSRTAAAVVGVACVLAAAGTAAAADTSKIDPIHSMVLWRVKHFGVGYIHGRFNEASGIFTWDEANPAASSLDVQLKADSLDSGNPKRDQHLKGPDFFNVKEYPVISFKSTRIRQLDAHSYEVTGDLTLHGATQPVTAKLEHVGSGKDPFGMYRTGFEATFTLKRSDFGMKAMLQGIGDEVRVTAAFEGIRQ
jgi:polyisoprenoid-binding protein YceI